MTGRIAISAKPTETFQGHVGKVLWPQYLHQWSRILCLQYYMMHHSVACLDSH